MHLEGQAGQRGYAMAALLVTVSIMAIAMTALLPVWRHQMQREKEAELAFRGEQYARAIYLFRRSNGNQAPPSLDVLVQGRYLRKKYKDPMTEDGEFQPIFAGQQQPGPPQPPGQRGAGPGQRGGGPSSTGVGSGLSGGAQGGPQGGRQGGFPGQAGGAGILTVQSKSKKASIRIYRNAAHYNEWQFLYNPIGRGGQPGGPGVPPGAGRPGAPGGGRGPGSGVGGPGGGRGPGGPGGRGPSPVGGRAGVGRGPS